MQSQSQAAISIVDKLLDYCRTQNINCDGCSIPRDICQELALYYDKYAKLPFEEEVKEDV